MQPTRGKTNQHIPRAHPRRTQQPPLVHHTGRSPGNIELVIPQQPRVFRRLPRYQGTIDFLTGSGHPAHQRRNPLGLHPPAGNIIRHEQRPNPRAGQVIHDHPHQVDPHRVPDSQPSRQIHFGAHPVSRSRQQRPTHPLGRELQVKQPRKTAGCGRVQHPQPLGCAHIGLHQLDRAVPGVHVDSGACVRVCGHFLLLLFRIHEVPSGMTVFSKALRPWFLD